jgi:hypothetical protein
MEVLGLRGEFAIRLSLAASLEEMSGEVVWWARAC